MNDRKGIGFLGLGSNSTYYYMREIAKYASTIENHIPFKMIQAKFDDINNHLPHRFEVLEPLITNYLLELERMEIDCFLIPNITLHETIDRLNWTGTKVIHPLKETLKQLKRDGIQKACVFGTVHTMNGSYISDFYKLHGIEIVRPSELDIQVIDTLRLEIYEKGINKKIQKKLDEVALKYSSQMAVIIACTELSVGYQNSVNPKLYDTVSLQLKGAFVN